MTWIVQALALGWIAMVIVGVFRVLRSEPLGYTVRGGRSVRWISHWTCKDCGTQNTCPRRNAGLRCKTCKSDREASVRFWYEQSKLPKKERHRPGVPLRPPES